MKYTMESDFAKHVKSSGQHNVYLLYGGQAYLIALYEKMIVKKALGGADEAFNLRRFDGDTLDLQTFYDAVESVPLMAACAAPRRRRRSSSSQSRSRPHAGKR